MSEAQIRSVSVRFDADISAYLAKMKLAGAATDAAFPKSGRLAEVNRAIGDETGKIDANTSAKERNTRSTTRATQATRQLGDEVDKTGRKLDSNGKAIDKYSGRLGALLDVALVATPALVTIGAELVPVTAAIGSNVAFMGVGAGVTMLAFHGLGDALTKFNKAALDPTAANIHNAQLAMDKLPPSAQRFVLELHRMVPELQDLQRIAADGVLPGFSAGLQAANSDLPILRSGIRNVSTEIGVLGRDAGQSLGSHTWRPFLKFLGSEAPHALDTLARAGGHTFHGLANLLMAFEPTTRAIDDGILRLAEDFDHWSQSVGRTQGFQDFLAYLRENGPRVIALLGQLGVTIVDIATAAAPLGGPTIEILTKLLDVLGGIASSDIGTPLIAGLIAFRLYARVAQLAGVQVETSFKGMAAAPGQVGRQISTLQARTTAYARQTVADLGLVTRAWLTAGATSEREAALIAGPKARLKGQAGGLVKGAAVGAGVALVASGATDSMGLTNTASLALAGSLAGPVGAAIGGAIGIGLDWKASLDAERKSLEELHQSTSSFVSSGDIAGLGEFAKQAQAAIDSVSNSDLGNQLAAQIGGPGGPITAFNSLSGALNQFSQGLTGSNSPVTKLADLQQLATRMQPAMTKLGLTFDDLVAMDQTDLTATISHLVRITNASESTSGKVNAVAHAFAAMGNQALTSEERVQGLSDALDSLFSPQLNLSAAADQLTSDLHGLAAGLDKNNKTLKGNSDAAIKNRGAIRGLVTDVLSFSKAQANANIGPQKMAASLELQRERLIAAATAAGISQKAIEDLLAKYKLTPHLIQTTIALVGTDQIAGELGRLRRGLEGLKDRTIHINVITTRFGVSDTTATGGHVLTGHADGGKITASGPYRDTIPALLAPREFIVSNRDGQADKYHDILTAINANRYAGGGSVGGVPSRLASPAARAAFGGGAVRVILPSGMHLTGTFDTPMGPGYMRAIASDTYHNERAADDRFEEARS